MKRHFATIAALAPPLAMLLGVDCRDATQITIAIALRSDASCADITSTAITVGAEAAVTEARVGAGEITTKTSQCNPQTHEIGTLVLTPGESARGALVVVVGYKGVDAAACKPPAYAGCIVVRRRFSFADHAGLTMPITIDPVCAGVACDAQTTCRDGACFGSEVAASSCADGVCDQPGELPDGATNEAGVVGVDSSVPPVSDAAFDGKVVGPIDPSVPVPSCNALRGLVCNGSNGPEACLARRCCDFAGGDPACTTAASCGTVDNPNYCCQNSDCASLDCFFAQGTVAGTPGKCRFNQLTCTPDGTQINCPDAPCAPTETCCVADPSNPTCAVNCAGDSRCCSGADCKGGSCDPQQFNGTVRLVCGGI